MSEGRVANGSKEGYETEPSEGREEEGLRGYGEGCGEELPLEERIKELQEKLEEERRAKESYLTGWQRCEADFDNFRKRVRVEREELASTVVETMILKVLPILDNLERALAYAQDNGEAGPLVDGISMVAAQFLDFLAKEGITPIKAVGLPFDPRKHEAIMHVETQDCEEGTVVEEVQRGYESSRKVIRPSLVKVAKRPPEPATVNQES